MGNLRTYRLKADQATQLRRVMFELWAEHRHVSDKKMKQGFDLLLEDGDDCQIVNIPAGTVITFFANSQAVKRTAKSRAKRGQSPRRYVTTVADGVVPDALQLSFTDEHQAGIKVAVRRLKEVAGRVERRTTASSCTRIC